MANSAVTDAAFAPDGTWFTVAGSHYVNVCTWNPQGLERHATLIGYDYTVTAVAASPDSAVFAAAVSDGTVRLYIPSQNERSRPVILESDRTKVTGVAFAPDGSVLAAVSDDGALRLWHVRTRQPAAVLRTGDRLRGCSWSPAGDLLAAVGSKGLYLFGVHAPPGAPP
ncbi:WD40 repeat domain-containing protein [Streptomyces poriticola]|uniref:WD40 repeat domain-containing protein n=1 Tax=Streptomyces poriticola TaxID=3120506 RepID=UPI002FCDE8EF